MATFNNKDLGTLNQAKQHTDDQIKKVSSLLYAVVFVCFLGFVTMLLDSFRFSTTTYKEYSARLESIQDIQKINNDAIEQNKKNQELISEQQRQIIKLLNK